jgi:hypothetical protein
MLVAEIDVNVYRVFYPRAMPLFYTLHSRIDKINGCALDKQSLKNKSVNRETVIYM